MLPRFLVSAQRPNLTNGASLFRTAKQLMRIAWTSVSASRMGSSATEAAPWEKRIGSKTRVYIAPHLQ